MIVKNEEFLRDESNFLDEIKFRYTPYLPLFAFLLLIFLPLAFLYIRYSSKPGYEIAATLVIDDEQKGVEEGQSLRALNVFATNKIVENEIHVLQSRTLIKNVIENLHLYAPMYEKGRIKQSSAYLTSPVNVEVKEPQQLKEQKEISFIYDNRGGSVRIDNKNYQLDNWYTFPYGTIRFIRNPNLTGAAQKPLYFSLISPQKVASSLIKNLQVNALSKLSSVVSIKYTDEVPERGEDVVDELLKVYNQASISNNNQLVKNTLAFVEKRLRDVEKELDSIEARVQQFKSNQSVVDLSEQGKIYLQSVAENDRKATDISMQLAILDQVEKYVRSGSRQTGIVPTTLGINDPVLADLLQKLNQLELENANLRTTTGENNSIVRSIESEIQKIRPNILNIVSNQRSQLSAGRNNVNSNTGRYTSMIRTIPQKERALLEISRQQAIKNNVYAFLLQRREEAALSNASTISDSRIVDRAEASITPVSSGRLLALLAAIAAAFGLGVIYIFFKEGLSGKVLFRSDIEQATSIPVIGEIVNRRYRKDFMAPLASDAVLAREFNQLQAALGLLDGSSNYKRFMVTSDLPKEGKTFISNLFAINLAATGKRTMLLDLNPGSSLTSELHQVHPQKGFYEYLQGKSDLNTIIQKTEFTHFDLISAGVKPGNSVALMLSSTVEDLFRQLNSIYECIIINSPPLELSTDAYVLSKYCDLTLFVIRHNVTPKYSLVKLNDNLKQRSFSNLNIVFNGIKPRGFIKKYYGYGYGYGLENVFKNKYYLKPG